ncbi:general transcription factor 3C polypeptide 3-like isoform X1 [Leptopilina boulardi]|uniref:general transcription factor 3C polypeptide 3-like isoform X1 n=1 Tax=Leptopilina boulardi TaxID=63433 RepID=UPI0021F5A2D8|nr:general transcription factor 3C polypeptide 3-like isoform X1 [Leptopilina boulardi]XP_051173691.1 general transcription factor 3C polypeptide 3-like isoform X1 [Leptopilina boulardi]
MESSDNRMEVDDEMKNSANVETIDNSSIAPVIIEELDESTINDMEMDLGEFVEAKAVKLQTISKNVNKETNIESSSSLNEDAIDIGNADAIDEQETETSREDLLTQQFLNGELTFTEYSLRMDNNRIVGDEYTDRKKRERKTKTRRKLPAALLGLMGEANLRFARGEPELAAQMCMEIIRQVPCAPEPFQTLTMIYENDQPEKSLQFALIAAHLSPKDADQWIRLANLSIETNNIKQAITCYSKAIQASPRDVSLYESRAKLQEQQGDKRAFLKNYTKLIHQLGPEDGESIIMFAKMLAKRYMQEKNYEHALDAMEQIFNKCSDLVTLEEVNVVTELLIVMKNFNRCLDILTKYTHIWVKYNVNELMDTMEGKSDAIPATRKIEDCGIPDDVAVDLKVKFLITLIELNEIEFADKLLPKVCEKENPEISGDLFLDIAESLMGKKQFKRALVLLEPLVNSKNFSLAAVWLRHAECWLGCNDIKKAAKSYEMVRKLSPKHLGARLELTKLYKQRGQFNKAIEILKQNPETDDLDPAVLYERTILLFKVGKFNEYFKSGLLLFSRHCMTLRSKSEMTGLSKATTIRQRLEALQLHRLSRGETIEDENAPTFVPSTEPSFKNEFALLLQMCKLAHKLKKFGLCQRIGFTALTSKLFEKKNSHIMFLCLVACIHNGDSYHGYNIVRELVRVHQKANFWNLLNIIIQKAEDSRHNRFIMRLLGREDVLSYLHILHANNCLVSGTYKYALNDYISLFKIEPNALLALLVAVTLLQMACQKFFAKKNQLVAQVLAFLKKYAKMRGEMSGQEINFNIARAFHQLGLLPDATHYYKRVLDLPPSKIVAQAPHLLDLQKEAAFNLHLIYLDSENPHLARMYLDKHIVI